MTLTPEQIRAISAPGSAIVMAAAGTGKTTVLTEHLVSLHVTHHVALDRILAMTFTENATHEMQHRITKRLAELESTSNKQPHIVTQHGFCQSIITQHAQILKLTMPLRVFDEQAFRSWLRHNFAKTIHQEISHGNVSLANLDARWGTARLVQVAEEIHDYTLWQSTPKPWSKYDPQTSTELDALIDLATTTSATLLKQRMDAGCITYNDMEQLCWRLLTAYSDILHALQMHYQHILVDECQDLSPQQIMLLSLLHHRGTNHIFAVGDPKQSIYAFRNADRHSFEKLNSLIASDEGVSVRLERTFRTPHELVTQWNPVFSQCFGTEDFEPATSSHTNPEAQTSFYSTANLADVAAHIHELGTRGTAYSDIAVITSKNSELIELSGYLSSRGIPSIYPKRSKFIDHALGRQIYSALSLLANHNPHLSLLALLRQIGALTEQVKTTITTLCESCHDAATLIKTVAEIHPDLAHRLDLASWLNFADKLDCPRLCKALFIVLKPEIHAENMVIMKTCLDLIQSWHFIGLKHVHALGSLLDSLADAQITLPSRVTGGVSLLTIHSAKGLEFKHVILIPGGRTQSDALYVYEVAPHEVIIKPADTDVAEHLDESIDNQLEHIRKKNKHDERTEMARVFYVAITRTISTLHIFLSSPSAAFQQRLKSGSHPTDICYTWSEWLYWFWTTIGAPEPHTIKPILPTTRVAGANHVSPTKTQLLHDLHPLARAKPTWSVSQLELFKTCPFRFAMQELFVLPEANEYAAQKKHETHGLNRTQRGILWHLIMKSIDLAKPDSWHSAILACHAQLVLPYDQKSIQHIVKSLFQIADIPLLKPLRTQNDMCTREVAVMHDFGSFWLNGQIDLLITHRHSSEITLIDYKTHFNLKNIELTRQNYEFQLRCYARMIQLQNPQMDISSHLVGLEHATSIAMADCMHDLEQTDTELQQLNQRLDTALRTRIFEHDPGDAPCKFCQATDKS